MGGEAFADLGRCELYAALATHDADTVARVMRLRYSLSRLLFEEWLRPLPPAESSTMHEPSRVLSLIAHLVTSPSTQASVRSEAGTPSEPSQDTATVPVVGGVASPMSRAVAEEESPTWLVAVTVRV